ncbi:hypothetical protein JVU11DRAFT_9347 [Chiua virens]|nr:hypothetical protein JVU11DRAFT_9347 [Chiua virens]
METTPLFLVIPDPAWSKNRKVATHTVDWLTHDVPAKVATELLQCTALVGLVYRGDPSCLRRKREGYTALLIHEKVLMWSWLKRNKCLVEFMEFSRFLRCLKSSCSYGQTFSKYFGVWGGVDLTVDPRYAPGLETWREVQEYVECLHRLHNTTPVWPPLEECQRASHKLLVVSLLDEIARTVTDSPRPTTRRLSEAEMPPLENVVIKREGSDSGRHVFVGKKPSGKLTTDEAGFAWFTQTRIETLMSVGEWRVIVVDMQVIRVVNTTPLENNLATVEYSQRIYGLSLEEMTVLTSEMTS